VGVLGRRGTPHGPFRRCLRHLIHFFAYHLILARQRTRITRAGGFRLVVHPTVFHPRFFLSSEYFAEFISHLDLRGKRVADVGCGGGILAESMATRGAQVTGIDLSTKAIGVARLHQYESGSNVDYRPVAAEALALEMPGAFDVVACLELLEHVPEPASTVTACATLVKPGGVVVFSTLNRNPKSYVQAILGAEYLLRLLPRGTHDWSRFLRPSELAGFARRARLDLMTMTGMTYNPLTKTYRLVDDTSVNYMAAFMRPISNAT